jgi:hypothetical protein
MLNVTVLGLLLTKQSRGSESQLCNYFLFSYLHHNQKNFSWMGLISAPQRCLFHVVVVGLVRLYDPESNAGGSLTTSRATHAGKVKG